jgi:uncharacterized membrane protein
MLTATTAPAPASMSYIASVDLMRGLVMVLMALDHVRWFFIDVDFYPTDLSSTDAAQFFTRWITHLCAPAFVFLAGTSAFLSAARGLDRSLPARRLFTRGLWLIVLEVTAVRFAWYFNLDYGGLELGVIWALGWSMVALSVLVYLPRWAIASIGIGMVAAHNLLDSLQLDSFLAVDGSLHWQGWLLSVLHVPHSPVVYPLIPWIGVMAAGYVFGAVFLQPASRRKQLMLGWGATLIGAFILLRMYNGYGDPAPWSMQETSLFTLLSFLNTTKYPPSLLFLLMTLGTTLILLALFEHKQAWHGPISRLLILFGRIPLFFYLLHLYVIHGLVVVFALVMNRDVAPFMASFDAFPPWWGFNLGAVYLIWIAVILLLYPACRWFAAVKARHKNSWWTPYI